MSSIDRYTKALEKEFTEFLHHHREAQPCSPPEEDRLIEKAVTHLYWSLGISRSLVNILIVDGFQDIQNRLVNPNRLTKRIPFSSPRHLGMVIDAKIRANLRSHVAPKVKAKLIDLGNELLKTHPLLGDSMMKLRYSQRFDYHRNDAAPELPRALNCFIFPTFQSHGELFAEAFLSTKLYRIIPSLLSWLEIYVRCPFYGLVDKTLVLGRAPVRISHNAAGKLHRTDGPAVEFADGTGVAFVDGVLLPERIFKKQHQIEISDILDEDNMEVRRVLMERMGTPAFLQEAKAKEIAHDDFGTLYHITEVIDEWEPLDEPVNGKYERPIPMAFVKLINSTPEPGTTDVFKEYLLRVPPDMQTPREAVAWSFNVDPDSYAPLKES